MTNMTKTSLAVITGLSLFVSGFSMASDEISSDLQKESYSIGASLGKYVSSQIYGQTQLGIDVDVDLVIQGVLDSLKGEQKFSDEEILTLLNQRAEQLNSAREARDERIAQESLKAGKDYLANNKKSGQVTETESGLQYEVLTMGKGRIANPEDVVTVHYKGTLVDGTEFDSTYERDEPNRFALMSVIEGWQEGITLMPEGSTFKFSIPAELAYGEKQVGIIPPSSTLIFEVELVKVEEPGENSHGMGLSGMGMGGMMGKGKAH
ncbi:FKBP-type peptidyl-prolyl cis-trans isomerase [Shewanella eurypsychrophilus]|uniref:Peptidyl-prolyl cis-trans isomerase n=1 Tax=Shewanella eurypsychrophilus TaxID=2593656 RepID=A0ABX6VB42_9GAMM|nr:MULTISPECIES: FKBP-type peptidyl-prolyl cis-trans isomerase [Shewanella]QFU24689.1 peptidylprolyl isomerase [Shewanella sp. YLB-09]QPG59881.1 FKBP-type peptidyl-prolyl cis-trans isomerase [Shewanella eurypsychrophilus]